MKVRESLAEARPWNRQERRDHIRTVSSRQVRINIVGFGKWRKHQEERREIAGHRAATIERWPLRKERRPFILKQRKAARRARRLGGS